MIDVRKNLIGVVFGRLIVLERANDYVSPSGHQDTQWLCECSCKDHNKMIVRRSNLVSKHTTSCGCLSREQAIQRLKKYNKYDLSGEYGIGWTLNANDEFYFDLEDYDKIKDYCWLTAVKGNRYRCLRADLCSPSKEKSIQMSNVVMGKNCDHINRNPLDNRKENLRFATPTENARNASIGVNNTSGFIGVFWEKDRNKWSAQIVVNYHNIRLGSFENKEDAIIARLKAEYKYFGCDFAPQRHLFEKYDINDEQKGKGKGDNYDQRS